MALLSLFYLLMVDLDMYQNNYLMASLRRNSNSQNDKVFINVFDTDTTISYGDFFKGSEKIATLFMQLGVSAGDRVLNYSPKTTTSLELYVGSVLAGAIYVPINDAYLEDDLSYFIDNADPTVIVCQDDSRHLVDKCLSKLDKVTSVKVFTLNADESGSLNTGKNAINVSGFSAAARGPDDIAAILYTSGTTGRPKGVVHTHRSLASNAETLASYWHFGRDDVLIHALPLFHLHGLFTATNVALYAACSMIYLSGFNVNNVMRVLPVATVLMGVPPFYTTLLKQSELSNCVKNMRLFISGSAPMLPQTHAEWRAVTGHTVLERYGMTEGSMIASNPYDQERRPNSVGFPLPGVDVRIVSPTDGEAVHRGEIGFVEIKGENLFSGYWRLPEKTAEDMKPDGYFISGDYGMYDADGYLHIIGRVKDSVMTAKNQVVYPKELEVLIDSVSGVNESAVIAVPSKSNYSLPAAIVVLSAGSELQRVEHEIKSLLFSELDDYKIPREIIFVDQLPRNIMGKVQKVTLREQYKDLFVMVE
ncbi:AMP-binding protein [Plesiomonas sp.]|uniref:AMP-binding protein n=1 Tax=Plesiomonas sp. TaxID=2486279 RepID=UPI003F3175C8